MKILYHQILDTAITSGDVEALDEFTEGPDLKIIWNGPAALSRACEVGSVSIVERLLQLSGNYLEEWYKVDQVLCHCSPLVLAARKGHVKIVHLLLRDRRININWIVRVEKHPSVTKFGSKDECMFCSGTEGDVVSYCALAIAAESDSVDLLNALLAYDPDMKIPTRFTKSVIEGLHQKQEFTDGQLAALAQNLTPLGLAARAGASKTTKILLGQMKPVVGSQRPNNSDLASRVYGRDDIRQARYLAMSTQQNATVKILDDHLKEFDAYQDRASQRIIIGLDFGADT